MRDAVSLAAPRLAGFVVLAAETDATGGVAMITPDFPALIASGRPIGLALRIHPQTATNIVEELAAQLVATAAAKGLALSEIQLDCDCPESKLEAYRDLVAVVRRRIAPTPLTITALPSWLRQPAFSNLAAAADGFVLQVHALDASLTLCDLDAARSDVLRASRYGVSFRVALPTYGYVIGVDAGGRVMGVQSEGPPRSWPADARLLDVCSDPVALATLVAEWNAAPPPGLSGFLWYRLPVGEDRLNWRWTTLAAIVDGRVPKPRLTVGIRLSQPGLAELELANDGEADAVAATGISVTWRDATLLACDALAGFRRIGGGASATALRFVGIPRLGPGERCAVGWLRFQEAREVSCEAVLE